MKCWHVLFAIQRREGRSLPPGEGGPQNSTRGSQHPLAVSEMELHALQADMRTMKRWHVLWAIRGLVNRWVALEHRRQARRRDYRQVLDPLTNPDDRQAIEACLVSLDVASSMEASPAPLHMTPPVPDVSLLEDRTSI